MKLIDNIKSSFNNSSDLKIKKVKNTYIIFINSICNLSVINDFIIKNILNNSNVNDYIGPSSKKINDKEIIYYLLNGYTIIIKRNIYAIETKGNLIRSIEKPSVETDMYGPKDSFNESIENNIGLIKRRIKTPYLINDDFVIGTISKTNICILYLKDITDINLVNKVKNQINHINIDSILSVGNIKQLLSKENRTFLPTIQETERPDLACNSLIEGKIILLMDNSPFAIIMPSFFVDFLNPQVDNYFKNININLIKIIRYLCLIITLIAPALYISLVNYNIESIPTDLLISFASQRKDVPFPNAIEAFIMLIIGSILKESDIRFPSTYGSSVSIVGALILGNAAVAAGLISPIMIIVIAITFISSMVFTDPEMVNSLRYYRFLWLMLASLFGIYGLFLGIFIFLIHISDLLVLGKPYTYPLAPFDYNYLKKTLIRGTFENNKYRSKLLVKKNRYKG